MSAARFRPFPNGSAYLEFSDSNCERCSKRFRPEVHKDGKSECAMETALALGYATTNGEIDRELAERIGIDGAYLAARCKEFHEDGTPPPVLDHPGQLTAFGGSA